MFGDGRFICLCGVGFQGQYGDAEELYKRCQAIREKALGADHPDLAATLYSRAGLLVRQVSTSGVVAGGSRDRVERRSWGVCGRYGVPWQHRASTERHTTTLLCIRCDAADTTSDMTSRGDHGMVRRRWSGHVV